MAQQKNAFEDFQVWQSPRQSLLDAIVSHGIPVEVTITAKTDQPSISVHGTFTRVRDNTAHFCPFASPDAENLDAALQGQVLPAPCRVSCRIDYDAPASAAIRPGEYSALGTLADLERDDDGVPTLVSVQLGQHFATRPPRRYDRIVWRPARDSLVRLLAAKPAPEDKSELEALLHEAMRLHDKSDDLVDISAGGACILDDDAPTVSTPGFGAFYLLLFSPHKNEKGALPYVFLAKQAGSRRNGPEQQGLRLHFVKELDWQASTAGQLVWREIEQRGSQSLNLLLQHSDSYAEETEPEPTSDGSAQDPA